MGLPRRTLGALASMVIASILPSVDGMVSAAMMTDGAAHTEDSVNSVSKDSVDASSQVLRTTSQDTGGEATNFRDQRVRSASESARRRRRRSKKASSTSTRRRRRRSSTRRRRRSKTSKTKKSEKASGKKASPAALKADAKANKIEAGWADMAKRDAAFTVFVLGSSLDKDKDRIVAIDGEGTCGSSVSRIAQVTGLSETPGGSLDDWKKLPCNAAGGSSSKLACGDGGSKGVLFKDDGFAEAYNFKVCVCDFSKRGKCDVMSDFDLTPTSSTLRVEPVV